MPLTLYYHPFSNPSRAVILTAKAIGIKLDLKEVDLFKGEHRQPEFLKINPRHQVPVLDDDGFILSESRAIMCYLVEKCAKTDNLYPKSLKRRAIVDQWLYFDSGVLVEKLVGYYAPVFTDGDILTPERLMKAEAALEAFDKSLGSLQWVTGSNMTIADISILATISQTETLTEFNVSKFPNVLRWYNQAKRCVEGYQETIQGAKEFRKIFAQILEKNKEKHKLSKMSIDLYYMPFSGPCNSVIATAKQLGVKVNLKPTDLMKGEHLTPEFLKMNPQHCIPTMNDNGLVLWESRAILAYLANKYGKNDSLYPKDPSKRALVDQRLYFDMGTLYQHYSEYYYPVLFQGATSYDPKKLERLQEAFQFLDTFLSSQKYSAGDNLTIADISIFTSLSIVEVSDFPIKNYPHVEKYFKNVQKEIVGSQEILQGAKKFREAFIEKKK